jgi:AcrR family transcriptional regulator
MKRVKPRGRRAGKSDARRAILHAARARFSRGGYGATSIRAIAAEAGVDSALVHHYFGSKQQLYSAANAMPDDSGAAILEALAAPSPGERLVLAFLMEWDQEGPGSSMAALMRSAASDPAAEQRLADLIATTLVTPATMAITRKQAMPKLRATLVATQLAGLAWVRYVIRTEPVASASAQLIARTLGASIDATLGLAA